MEPDGEECVSLEEESTSGSSHQSAILTGSVQWSPTSIAEDMELSDDSALFVVSVFDLSSDIQSFAHSPALRDQLIHHATSWQSLVKKTPSIGRKISTALLDPFPGRLCDHQQPLLRIWYVLAHVSGHL